jgi:hypothetical protein
MSQLLILLIIMVSFNAQAGFRRGNGESVLICGQDGQKTYQVLDLFEAQSRYNFTLQLAVGSDEYQKAQGIIDRFGRLNPSRQKIYSQWLKTFESETQFIDGLNIVGIPDVGVSYIPDSCELKQMIVQVEPLTKFERRYTIDLRIWKSMDMDQRAAAIVHELIYREAISFENQHNSSEPTRLMNAFVHSTLMEKVSLQDWIEFVQDLGFHRTDAHGYPIKLNAFTDSSYSRQAKSEILFQDANHVQRAQLPYVLDLKILGKDFQYSCANNLVTNDKMSMITFHPNGMISDISFSALSKRQKLCPDLTLNIFGDTLIQGNISRISYRTDGSLDFVSGSNNPTRNEFDELKDYLQVETKHVSVTRNFKNTQEWVFILNFENNQPTLLQNTHYDNETSVTILKNGEARTVIPNSSQQSF